MTPVSPVVAGFAHAEVTYAKDQPEYLPLPTLPIGEPEYGVVLSRWRMTWRERFLALWRGDVYLEVMTFGQRLQPVSVKMERPLLKEGTV